MQLAVLAKGSRRILRSLIVALVALLFSTPAHADPSVQIAWRLLDYIAVDYREAVKDGKVANPGEYAEMTEFARSAKERIDGLADNAAKANLQEEAVALQTAIAGKASPDDIAVSARGLASHLIAAYPVPLAPQAAPDVALGKILYAKQCATCHGIQGGGDGPGSAGLDPPPIAFADKERARERSIFGLYQVIEQGLDGTSMPSFAAMPADERWALACYVGTFSYPEADAAEGKQVLAEDPKLAEGLNLEKLVGITPATLGQEIGDEKADNLVAYLRNNPAAVIKAPTGSLALARTRLDEALKAYQAGDNKAATNLALSAYLDGFEPVEAILATRDSALMARVETGMGALRNSISSGASVEDVEAQINAVDALFAEVETAIAPETASLASSFFGAFAILLREGLEALLIVVAMLGFLRKAERGDLIPYVHGGWVTALGAGVATWGIATWLITISGATRELTEGFGSIFAAMLLLWVGIWMHGKSNAQVWQQYVHARLSKALTKRSAWFLFGLAFLVVYREVFETILFYAAIWGQGNGAAVLAGAGAAILCLTAIAWAMMGFSKRLPIHKFFSYSSSLIAVLSVVLIGKGVAALQEAGYIAAHSLSGFPRVEILGMYPTMEGAAAQAVMIALLLLGFTYNARAARNKAS